MKNTLTRLSVLFALVVALSCQVLGAPEQVVSEPLKVIQTQSPVFPSGLNRTGVTKGFAVVGFSVDAEGNLIDYMPIAYTHEEFYKSAIGAFTRWRFEPAREAGQPRSVVMQMTFNFESGRNVIEMRVGDDINAQYNRMRPTAEVFRIWKLNELDQIPVPVSIVSPGYPEAFLGSLIEGTATIEFYIDETGDVRLPAVIEQSAGDFAGAAMDAVLQWKFEPPLKEGKPVAAVARQQFTFAPSDLEAEPAAKGPE